MSIRVRPVAAIGARFECTAHCSFSFRTSVAMATQVRWADQSSDSEPDYGGDEAAAAPAVAGAESEASAAAEFVATKSDKLLVVMAHASADLAHMPTYAIALLCPGLASPLTCTLGTFEKVVRND